MQKEWKYKVTLPPGWFRKMAETVNEAQQKANSPQLWILKAAVLFGSLLKQLSNKTVMLVFSGLRERRQWRMNYLQQEQSHFRDANSDEEAESPQRRCTVKSFGPDGSKTFAQHSKILFVPRSHCGKNKKRVYTVLDVSSAEFLKYSGF